MIKFDVNKQYYRVAEYHGAAVSWMYIHSLPPKKGSQINWQAEVDRLSEEITGKGGYFNPVWTFPYTSPRGRVVSTVRRYHKMLDSLPPQTFQPDEEAWTETVYQQTKRVNPTATRLKFIGALTSGLFPAITDLYPVKSGVRRPLRLYQCTCGRNVVLPQSIPARAIMDGCGCRHKAGPRTQRQRRLDAFREWVTMFLSCYDKRSKYYDTNNSLDIPSFTVFNEWYSRQTRGEGMQKRFVRRKSGKQFRLDNLTLDEPTRRGTKL